MVIASTKKTNQAVATEVQSVLAASKHYTEQRVSDLTSQITSQINGVNGRLFGGGDPTPDYSRKRSEVLSSYLQGTITYLTYTAPCDGYIVFSPWINPGGPDSIATTRAYLVINGYTIGAATHNVRIGNGMIVYSGVAQQLIPVKKGTALTCRGDGSAGGNHDSTFIPCRGSTL